MENKKKYMPRLIDKKIDDYLKVMGAVSIEGPKWCGKTLTSLNHCNSVVYLDDVSLRNMAKLNVNSIFYDDEEKIPELIDEWRLVPEVWDAVRRECDNRITKGNFILTCSTSLTKESEKNFIYHTGTGRIAKINMYTMSLFESNDSDGKASIMSMYDKTLVTMNIRDVDIRELARLIVRGGWPENLRVSDDLISIIPSSYIKSVLNFDTQEFIDERAWNADKMQLILKSLARNESTIVSNQRILSDIGETATTKEELITSKDTLRDYLDCLERLHIIENQNAFSVNFRSSNRVGKSPKRHLTDPSLVCALLDLSVDKLMKDLNTFGFLFESLVIRDLRIYMDYLDGKVYHFRDNASGQEVDAILEFKDGSYAAIEVKLAINGLENAKKSLMNFYESVDRKPIFMCVILGKCNGVLIDKETGIYVVPITSLRP